MGRRRASALNTLFQWVRRQSMKVKIFLALAAFVSSMVVLRHFIEDVDHFFLASEVVHAAGVVVLIYKLATIRTCSGISLKTQELTAIFLAVRLLCSYVIAHDIYSVIDLAALVATVWVIYMIRFNLKATYNKELDKMPLYYLLVPCAVLALIIHPHTYLPVTTKAMWAFCVYLESISVLPQLIMMQKMKMIEPFTAHYVFALGVARFLGFGHWVIRVYESAGTYLFLLGSGYFWLPMVLLAEVVQTFILADFCYYYVKSVMNGRLLISLPRV